MRPYYYMALILCLCRTTFADTNAAINGWRSAKWGMTADQVLAAFPGEAIKAGADEKWRNGVCLVKIESLELVREKFEAHFIFDFKNQLLRHIEIRPLKDNKFQENLFVPLEQKLIEKYGKIDFSSDESKPMIVRKRSWKRGPTRIELKYLEPVKNDEMLMIIFEQIPDVDNKNL